MKSLISAVAVAVLFAAPIASFAQSSQQPVTRAQVRAELVQLEKAGYNPAINRYDYPVELQAAEQRVAAQNAAVAQTSTDTSGYGSAAAGSSQHASAVATPVASDGVRPTFFGN